MSLWVLDPKDGKPSVSLSILIISVVYLITIGVLQVLGKVQETGMAMEFFGISAGLYFGRRVQLNKGVVDVNEENK